MRIPKNVPATAQQANITDVHIRSVFNIALLTVGFVRVLGSAGLHASNILLAAAWPALLS
jgi:hypothetical protein